MCPSCTPHWCHFPQFSHIFSGLAGDTLALAVRLRARGPRGTGEPGAMAEPRTTMGGEQWQLRLVHRSMSIQVYHGDHDDHTWNPFEMSNSLFKSDNMSKSQRHKRGIGVHRKRHLSFARMARTGRLAVWQPVESRRWRLDAGNMIVKPEMVRQND